VYVCHENKTTMKGDGFASNLRLGVMSSGQDDERDGGGRGNDTGVITQTKPRTKKPSMYKVLLLNDDYTPMEFVVYVLQRFFQKTGEDATTIMLHVHQNGVGICGVFTYEVAETKVTQVMDLARQNDHPLQCTMEKD
jgi:ATP-dependent Clp protease adaptor protein ClpS